MKALPLELDSGNVSDFPQMYCEYKRKQLREAIFVNILGADETDYFDLDIWTQEFKFNRNIVDIQEVLKPILSELSNLNWYYTFSYGKTALFIHKDKTPPKNCYNSEFEEI